MKLQMLSSPPNYQAHSNIKRSRVVIFLLAKSDDLLDQHVTMINLIPTLGSIGRSFPQIFFIGELGSPYYIRTLHANVIRWKLILTTILLSFSTKNEVKADACQMYGPIPINFFPSTGMRSNANHQSLYGLSFVAI